MAGGPLGLEDSGGVEGGGHSREVTAVSKGARQKMTQRVGER